MTSWLFRRVRAEPALGGEMVFPLHNGALVTLEEIEDHIVHKSTLEHSIRLR
jgi:hypothetical protein